MKRYRFRLGGSIVDAGRQTEHLMSTPTPQGAGESYEQRRGLLTDQIAKLGPTLPGSLVKRSSRCGNAGCRCRGEPPQLHGPYWTWTRSEHSKTVTRQLTEAQAHQIRPWLDNARQLRELTTQLRALALEQATETLKQDR